MKHIILFCHLIISLGLLLQGCAYGPHIVEVPLMRGKNDAKINVGLSFPTLALPAISLSATYAPTDHFAIQGQGEYMFNNYYHAQLAFGYYHKFANNTVLENYYGAEIGNGTGWRKVHVDENFLSGTYTIGFTQINYGKIGLKANGEVGGGLKIGYQYGEFFDHYYYHDKISTSAYSGNFYYHGLVLEPTIFYRFGWEHFKIGFQLSGCYAPSLVKYKLPYAKFSGGISFSYQY